MELIYYLRLVALDLRMWGDKHLNFAAMWLACVAAADLVGEQPVREAICAALIEWELGPGGGA